MKKTDSVYVYVITLFFVPIMLTLLFMSTVSTSYVTWADEVFFLKDNALVNIILSIVFTGLTFCLSYLKPLKQFCKKINENERLFRILKTGLLALLLLITLMWVWSTRFSPFGDAAWLHDAADKYVERNYDAFKNGWFNYLDMYPFQARTLLIFSFIDSIFGGYKLMVYETLNCVFTVVMVASLSDISRFMGADRATSVIVILISGLWLPTILYNSFVYGNVPGLSLAVLSLDLWLHYFKRSRLITIVLSVLVLALSVCFKSNFLIVALAMIVYSVFKGFSDKKTVKSLSAYLLLIVVILVVMVIPKKIITVRSGEPLNEGMSMIGCIDMGLSESTAGPGWYTDDDKYAYQAADFKKAGHESICREDIKRRLDYFKSNKNAAIDFFIRKTASQWNEPTYGSFWILRASEKESNVLISTFSSYRVYVKAVSILDIFQLLIILGCVFFILAFREKEKTLEALLLPMIFIGMFLFHIVWEAKSQYAFLGIMFMLPVAVMGYTNLPEFIKGIGKKENPESKDSGKYDRVLSVIKVLAVVLTVLLIVTVSLKGLNFGLIRDNYDFAEYLNENFG